MSTDKKIKRLQEKVAKLTEKLKEEISVILGELDYHNGSRFSYNIDRIERFNKEIQEFEIIDYDTNRIY